MPGKIKTGGYSKKSQRVFKQQVHHRLKLLNLCIFTMKFARYLINGLVATGVHFSVLLLNIEIFEIQPAALANLFAAIFGTASSFIGNRYFVFKAQQSPLVIQIKSFLWLYTIVAVVHGLVLFCWTDLGGLDYRAGFIVATSIQMLLGYWGNKMVVFRI